MEDGSRLRIEGNFWDGSRNSFLLRLFPMISQEIVHWSRFKIRRILVARICDLSTKGGLMCLGGGMRSTDTLYKIKCLCMSITAPRGHESKSLTLSDSLCFIQQTVEHGWSLTGQKHINHLKNRQTKRAPLLSYSYFKTHQWATLLWWPQALWLFPADKYRLERHIYSWVLNEWMHHDWVTSAGNYSARLF